MYNNAVVPAAMTTAASLPFTGMNTVWMGLAAFTLLAAGGALRRIAPRREA